MGFSVHQSHNDAGVLTVVGFYLDFGVGVDIGVLERDFKERVAFLLESMVCVLQELVGDHSGALELLPLCPEVVANCQNNYGYYKNCFHDYALWGFPLVMVSCQDLFYWR